jgi:hypothetical protein
VEKGIDMSQGIVATGCVYRIVDASGNPLSGAKLYTYEAGTTTPLAVYTDGALTTPATNPVVMNANGEATLWFGLDEYKLIEKTAADVTLRTVDNISGNFLTKAAADLLYFPIAGPVDLSGSVLTGAVPLSFEGATSNAYETSLAITDPTADRTVTIQDKSGTIALKNDEYFSGTTTVETLDVGGIATTITDGSIHVSPGDLDIYSQLDLTIRSGGGDVNIGNPASGAYLQVGNAGNEATLYDSSGVAVAGWGDVISATLGKFWATGIYSGGNILVISSSSKLGYGTGAGGTVTQITDKSTAVTLNKPCGRITMNNAALAGGASVAFAVNNSVCEATSVVVLAPYNNGSYRVETWAVTAGQFVVRVTNLTGGSLSEALEINFALVAVATS